MKFFASLKALALVTLVGLFAIPAQAQVTRFSFDPTDWVMYLNEFEDYQADHWVITTTEAGAGDATEATGSVAPGVLIITNDAADDDADFLQWSGATGTGVNEMFKFVVGKRLYFKTRFKVSDATQSDIVIGLQIADTTPLDVTDGIFFQKDDGDAFLDLRVEKNNTATNTTAISTLANDTFVTVAFYYDGVSSDIKYYVNGVLTGSSVLTNVVDDEDLAVSIGLQNGEAVAKILTVDYIFVAQER